MGLNAEPEKQKNLFSLCGETEVGDADGERMQKLEDSVQLLKMQADFLAKGMVALKKKTENFTKHMDHKLEELLNFERKRSDELMVAYTRLKVKYDTLLKTGEGGEKD